MRAGFLWLVAVLIAQGAGTRPRFEPAQAALFAAGGTLVNAAADYDRDGDADIFVGFNSAPNRLYRNEGGRFADVATAAGLADARPTRAAAWGDYDGDGDPDILVGFAPGAGPVLRLYRNDGGTFVDVTGSAGLTVTAGAVRQPSWVDVDGDGDLDLFIGFRDRADALFRNEKGLFTDVAADAGLADTRKTVGAVWFDFDEDGDLDLYAAHMDGDDNALLRNDGGRFTDVAAAAGLERAGRPARDAAKGTVRPCVADIDGDGLLDLFAANYGPNGVLRNRGRGRFEDVSAAWGAAIDARYDTCAFSDIDHDGQIDLYVNGTVTGGVSYRDYLMRNTGRRFEDVTPQSVRALDADHGALFVDVDHDGDEDLALTGAGAGGTHPVLINDLAAADAARSLQVRVLDPRGRAIRAGAEVRLYAAGTRRLLGTRLVDTGSSYNAQSDIPLHFGLPSPGRVDIEVTWPAKGRRDVTRRRNVDPANTRGHAVLVKTIR